MSGAAASPERLRDLALLRRVRDRIDREYQHPLDQPYGVRDCAFRDPAGNMVRIQQVV